VRAELKEDIASVRAELKEDIASVRAELKEDIASVRADMQAVELRMTLRLGGLVVAGVAILAVLELIP
jgi:hypothetical protein